LVQSVEHATLDLRVVNSRSMLGVEITQKFKKKKIFKKPKKFLKIKE